MYETRINPLRPTDTYMPIDAYMRQPLVQIIACPLFGAKPLSEPMLTYRQLDTNEYISVNGI